MIENPDKVLRLPTYFLKKLIPLTIGVFKYFSKDLGSNFQKLVHNSTGPTGRESRGLSLNVGRSFGVWIELIISTD